MQVEARFRLAGFGLLALALGALLLAFAGRALRSPSDLSPRPAASIAADGPVSLRAAPELPTSRAVRVDESLSSQRVAAVPREDPPVSSGPRLRLRCVERDTGRPLPGAQVHYGSADLDFELARIAAFLGGEEPKRTMMSFAPWSIADADGWVELRLDATQSSGGWFERGGVVAMGFAEGFETLRSAGGSEITDGGELEFAPLGLPLTVRVVDRHGSPVRGVVAQWTCEDEGLVASARTGADGIARVPRPADAAYLPAHATWKVAVAGLFDLPVAAETPNAAEETVELRLPPHGWVRLRAEGVRDVMGYGLEADGSGETRALVIGTDVLVPVALGRTLTAQAGRLGGSEEEWRGHRAGPRREGEFVNMVLRRELTQIAGRAVDDRGAPLADVRLTAHGASARTDAEGRFRLAVETSTLRSHEVSIEAARSQGPWIARVPALEGAADAAVELGDLEFTEDPPAVRGRVVDSGGAPIAGLRLEVRDSERGGIFYSGERVRVTYLEDGRFEIRGLSAEVHAPLLVLDVRGYHREERAFERGEDIGEWIVHGPRAVRGRLLVDEGLDRRSFFVAGRDGMSGPVSIDGAFELRTFSDGADVLYVVAESWVGPLLVAWEGAPLPRADEPLLLDVRGRVRTTEVTLRTEGDDSPPVLVFRSAKWAEPESPEARASPEAPGVYRFHHGAPPVRGRFEATGFTPVEAVLDGGALEVTLVRVESP